MSPRDLVWQLGLTRDELARLACVSRRQVQAWDRAGTVPARSLQLILAAAGSLPDPAWSGWRLRRGRLWAPEGHGFSPAEVRAIPWLQQQIEALRSELERPRQVVLL